MRWRKLGLVFAPEGRSWWQQAYAFPPTPLKLDDQRLRLYLCFCDRDTVGRVGYVDVSLADPREVLEVSDDPVLDIGQHGAFDDNGVLPTCVLDVDGRLYLYYVGYQLGTKVKYFQFQGLAVSTDGGQSFERLQRVPVLERSTNEMLNRTSAFVMREAGRFRMWYVGGSEWLEVNGKPLPLYNLRHLESCDGISWGPDGKVCLDFASDDEHAFGRPWVVHAAGGGYRMFYSVRTRSKDYRLGYAQSEDGLAWERRDHEVGIDVSPSGWDSQMIAYSSIVTHRNTTYPFYNGNLRGKTGFGVAVLEDA
jgi:hypothetical protein